MITKRELEKKGLLVFTGKEIIETLKEDYELFNQDKQMTFETWLEPVVLNELELDKKYIIDGDISFTPFLLDENFVEKKQGIKKEEISDYLSNVVTIDNELNLERDNVFSFYIFDDIEDYMSIETIEGFDAAHKKLDNHEVDVTEPFLELACGSHELYINTEELNNEKEMLNFLNRSFEKAHVDSIAIYFNHNNIKNTTTAV